MHNQVSALFSKRNAFSTAQHTSDKWTCAFKDAFIRDQSSRACANKTPGIAWVNSKTGDTSFQDMVSEVASNDKQWVNWRPEVFENLDSNHPRELPPKEECVNLVLEFFSGFNQARLIQSCIAPLSKG